MEYPPTYRNAILRHYNRQNDASNLSPNMRTASPANLRSECSVIFLRGLKKKDEIAFNGFFGEIGDGQDTAAAIENFDTVRFRPLSKFLNGKTGSPDLKQLELLAWLINFEPRPYQKNVDYNVDINETENGQPPDQKKPINISEPAESLGGSPNPNDESSWPHLIDHKKSSPKNSLLYLIVAASLLAFIGFFGFWYLKKDSHAVILNGTEQCMYWAGDHFQPIPCNQKMKSAKIVALDSSRIKNFRQITTPDTISRLSIGRLWYAKKNNELSYFTDSGEHPLHQGTKIRVLTVYIYEKYIEPLKVRN